MARRPEWIRYRWGREEFAAAPKAMSTVLKTPVVMEIVGMIAEDSQVAVEAQTDAELMNGKQYDKDRKSVVMGKSVSVSVDLGGRRIIKKKKNNDTYKKTT